jgi:ribose 5-phosphate isomerase A
MTEFFLKRENLVNLKQVAAEEAVKAIQSGMKLGLGTGSTIQFLLQALGERLRNQTLSNIVGVPTSEATTQQAHQLGIPLTTLDECPQLDLTIDGADEVTPNLDLIKGLGGALLREKIVAAASTKLLIIVDASKQVAQLGTRSPLPVEVLSFGWKTHFALFERLGATPNLRKKADGSPFITDSGNLIIDCTFLQGITEPQRIQNALDAKPGIVGHGLFLGMTTSVIVASAEEIRILGPDLRNK